MQSTEHCGQTAREELTLEEEYMMKRESSLPATTLKAAHTPKLTSAHQLEPLPNPPALKERFLRQLYAKSPQAMSRTTFLSASRPQNLPSSYSLTHWDEFRSTTTHNSLVTSTAHDWRREPDAQGFKHQRDDPDLDFEAESLALRPFPCPTRDTLDVQTDSEYFVAHIGARNVHSIAILAALGFNVVWIFAVFDEVGMRIVDPWDMS
ncbi:hypothetical protein EI94DRAFT_1708300 [Lactarius quietus]|nr:hypothetical protein EI94DRAFT_1708300 [Lactarius quietus]